ncbi:hypothetical protein SERLA73DRAFT_149189 [Serpula lacrymans var. lacrymans S7.3]|uniref:Uncharacterized protein n=1 Tax=Serpula lacrymans var. lacrymans (strain S7.3) TaxID=936435 RepID=F8PGC5_SERL3|nr:hypothetical protein SERLA73DRAFT_149189 [Serpula lacrymans var. lacrymans S7.3]
MFSAPETTIAKMAQLHAQMAEAKCQLKAEQKRAEEEAKQAVEAQRVKQQKQRVEREEEEKEKTEAAVAGEAQPTKVKQHSHACQTLQWSLESLYLTDIITVQAFVLRHCQLTKKS